MYFPIKGLARILFPHKPLDVFPIGNDPYQPCNLPTFTKDDYACFSTGEDVVITSIGTYQKINDACHAGPAQINSKLTSARFLCYALKEFDEDIALDH